MTTQGAPRLLVTPRVLLFLERDERLLLIEGAAHKWWAGRLNGLGGSVERGESILAAANDDPRALRLLGTLHHLTGHPDDARHVLERAVGDGEAQRVVVGEVEQWHICGVARRGPVRRCPRHVEDTVES